MTPLSPAAQAVLDAFLDSAVDVGNYYATRSRQIAAALREAADQVIPDDGVASSIERIVEKRIHSGFLAIAAELEQAANINTTEALSND
jgi:hypothetical protein